jgi:hypothetical protein
MNSAFVALLLSGLVIGIICFIVGSGLILLRIKGTATLTNVPGVGEVSTLRLGLTMMSIGGYFFWHAAATYLPLQKGAELQSRVDALLISTAREVRREFGQLRSLQSPVPAEKVGRANFLVSFIEHVDRNNGHALYFQAEIKLKEGAEETARHFFYRYIEAEEALGHGAKGAISAEVCYERADGYCRQRTGWIHHQLSSGLFREAEGLTTGDRQRELYSRALNHANSAMRYFPGGFEQRPSTQWLLTELERRGRESESPSMTAGRFAPSWPR